MVCLRDSRESKEDIFSKVFPEKRLIRAWSLHSPIFSMKSSGSFSRMVMSWDTRDRVTPKWVPAVVYVL